MSAGSVTPGGRRGRERDTHSLDKQKKRPSREGGGGGAGMEESKDIDAQERLSS